MMKGIFKKKESYYYVTHNAHNCWASLHTDPRPVFRSSHEAPAPSPATFISLPIQMLDDLRVA